MGFAELGQFEIDESSVRLLGEAFCRKNQVVVLGVRPEDRGAFNVGMLNPGDGDLIHSLERSLGARVRPVQLNAYEIQKALDTGFQGAPTPKELRPRLKAIPKLTFDPSAPVVDVLNEVLALAVTKKASDVHIEAHDDDVDIRFRVDGVLHQSPNPIAIADLRRVMARLKILGGLDIAETRAPQDGRILATYDSGDGKERPIDFRLSILPGPYGEDAVIRVLDPSRQLVDLPKLGLPPAHLDTIRELDSSPEGLFLVTGPTGSGKTTTLYSILREISDSSRKVLTVEDPIEYRFPKISQKQVTPKLGFAAYARAFLRQDPDVILIGEIRDEDTAEVAMRAGQTGHLVLSTIHTNDSVATLGRLVTLGVEPENIASTLLAALAQRLVRKICTSCRKAAELSEDDRAVAHRLGAGVESQTGAGCEACGREGYSGRIGIYELFLPDAEIADMIANGGTTGAIRERAREKGMKVLVEDGLAKVEAGVTSFSELRRSISYRLLHEYRPPRETRDG